MYHNSQKLTGYNAYTVSVIFLPVVTNRGPKEFFAKETHCCNPAETILTIMAYRPAGAHRS